MRQVPIRELNQHTAEVMARAEMGERGDHPQRDPGCHHRAGTAASSGPPDRVGELSPARGPLPTFSGALETASDSAGLDAVLENRYGDGRW